MKNIKFLFLSTLAISLLAMSCKDDDSSDEVDCATFEWSYTGDSAPDAWSGCNPDCGGQSQSPIDITGAVVDASLAPLDIDYNDVSIDLINNGKTVEFNYAAGSTLTLNGEVYELLQFHFHTLSEHTVNENHFPMEIHLVHQNAATSDLAVVSILVEEGNENPFLANFSDNYPAAANDTFKSADMVNVGDLLPSNGSYFNYGGSLTTPPCSESVSWMVMKTPVQASAAQINNMANILQSNYRPVQALNGRGITEFN